MGALIAGLFGMNVSPIPCPPRAYPPSHLTEPPDSLRATWKNTLMPLRGCLWHPLSSHFLSHGLVFEGRFSRRHLSDHFH